jgi:hypothetical protein
LGPSVTFPSVISDSSVLLLIAIVVGIAPARLSLRVMMLLLPFF